MIIVSACFANINCRYDGKSKPYKWIEDLVKSGQAIPICPEVLGGLPIPRAACEIVSGETGRTVIDAKGMDRTPAFELGALRTLEIAKACGATLAIMKSCSPSCGCGEVYDGTFSGTKVKGNGVAVEALIESGLSVFNENDEEKFRIFRHFLQIRDGIDI